MEPSINSKKIEEESKRELMGIDGAKLIIKYNRKVDMYGFGRMETLVGEDDGFTYFSREDIFHLISILLHWLEIFEK